MSEQLHKQASKHALIGAAGLGAINSLLLDHLQTNAHTGNQIPIWSTFKDLFTGNMDSERLDRLGANALFGGAAGAVAGGLHGNVAKKLLAASSKAERDAISMPWDKILGIALAAPGSALAKDALLPVPATLTSFRNNQLMGTIMKGALGVGALGLGGAALAKYLTSRDGEGDVAKARYKIQGKPGDPYSDAEIEVPIDDPEFSDSMLADIGKNVRNQARKNLRSNTTKMDPKTGQQIPFDEWDRKYGNMTEDALRELKQKHGTLKNVPTDDDDSGFFSWGKSAAAIYLTSNVIKQASAPMPPQPVKPMGGVNKIQPTAPAGGPNPIQAKMTRPVPPGSTPAPSTGIAGAGAPDVKRLHKSVSAITRNIHNIAQSAMPSHSAQQTVTPSNAQTASSN